MRRNQLPRQEDEWWQHTIALPSAQAFVSRSLCTNSCSQKAASSSKREFVLFYREHPAPAVVRSPGQAGPVLGVELVALSAWAS